MSPGLCVLILNLRDVQTCFCSASVRRSTPPDISVSSSVCVSLQSDIMDVNQIFKDLAVMIHDQGEMIGG